MGSTYLIGPRDPDWASNTSRIREEFLSEGHADLAGVRPLVARSWFRSRAAGVDPIRDREIFDEGRVDAQTVAAAEPFLRKLDELVADVGGYVNLTAPNGVIVFPSFLREVGGFPAGYSLLEENCGSNGEGLALEEGRSAWLAPEEHFREDMRGNWCFASLVRDPFHNRVRAVIGLTFPNSLVENLDPASTLLMLEGVATQIGRELEATSSAKERALLNEYLTISRRHGGTAVVALDGKNSLMNATATASLEDGDFSIVSSYAREVMSSARGTSCDVNLKGPGTVTLEISPVHLARTKVGAIVIIRPKVDRARPRTGRKTQAAVVPSVPVNDALAAEMDWESDESRHVLALVDRALAQGRSVVFVGEGGTGKRRLAIAMARRMGEGTFLDCNGLTTGGEELSDSVQRAVTAASDALVLENADALLRPQAQELARALKAKGDTRVLLTVIRPTEATLLITKATDALEIALAPLRHRREDIPVLARAFAEELGGKALSRRLVAALTDSDWPENADQLRAVVSNAIERCRGSEVTVDDLPLGFDRALSNGRLTRLEDAELSELRIALREAEGNRRLAAELLQIGRSTLYRRMDYFRGRGFDL